MGAVYTLRSPSGGLTVSTAITVLQLKAGTNRALEILRAGISQRGSVTSVQEKIALIRKTGAATVTAASAGTHLNKHDPNSAASDVSLGTSATGYTGTSEGTDGELLIEDGFNVLSGWVWLPTPEERMIVPPAGIIALKFLTAPASQSWYPFITFREM